MTGRKWQKYMELFNYYDNFVIDILTKYLKDEGGTVEDYNDFFIEKFGNFSQYFYPSSIDPLNQYSVLKKNEDQEYTSLFYDIAEAEELKATYNYASIPPVLLNKIELDAIRNAMISPSAKIFFNEEEIKEIQKIFNYDDGELPDTDWDERDIIKKFYREPRINAKLCKNLRILIQAIVHRKVLKLTNTAKTNVIYKEQILYPLRLEFTPNTQSWTITAYSVAEKRPNSLNPMRLNDITIEGDIPNSDEIEELYKDFIHHQKKQTVTIYVTAPNYVLDRLFRVFSHYSRKITYHKKNNTYTVEITYYTFDEQSLLLNLISFGPYIEVKEPENLRNKMIKIIKSNLPD